MNRILKNRIKTIQPILIRINKINQQMKMKKKNSVLEQVKAARKQSREEEIKTHGKSINYRKVMESKKQYNRKKNKADDEVLPYLFLDIAITE